MTPVTFDELYREHAPAVHRFAHVLSGRSSDADDITAETFVRAWTATGEIRLTTVRAYLLTIARNIFLQRSRTSRRTAPLEDVDSFASPEGGPERDAAGREELASVASAFRRLPEIDRSALGMRIDGASIEDIASSLAMSPIAIKVRIHRARLKLAALLSEPTPKGETP
jgi:RNA polymerase sigma-70 factor (ECF subfamily)